MTDLGEINGHFVPPSLRGLLTMPTIIIIMAFSPEYQMPFQNIIEQALEKRVKPDPIYVEPELPGHGVMDGGVKFVEKLEQLKGMNLLDYGITGPVVVDEIKHYSMRFRLLRQIKNIAVESILALPSRLESSNDEIDQGILEWHVIARFVDSQLR